jgi:hypothetical protein
MRKGVVPWAIRVVSSHVPTRPETTTHRAVELEHPGLACLQLYEIGM